MTLESFSPANAPHPVRLADHRARRTLTRPESAAPEVSRPLRNPSIIDPAVLDRAAGPVTVLVLAVDGLIDPSWLREVLDPRVLSYRQLSPVELADYSDHADPLNLPIDAPVVPLSGASAPNVLRVGELVMDLEEMRVRVSGAPIALTHQEFLLLRTFLENPDRLFTRRQLLEQAWDYAEWGSDWGSGRTVDVHVRRLRVKLGEAASIATVRGFGYRFEPTRDNAA